MTELPAFFKIAAPPAELALEPDDDRDQYRWRRDYDYDRGADGPTRIQAATTFPEAIEVEADRMFACSGSVDSLFYREATRYLPLSEMGWEEARVALNRLVVDRKAGYVRLAELALAADGNNGFLGKKGDHAAKLREALADARAKLRHTLDNTLETARRNALSLDRPITAHGRDLGNANGIRDVAAAIAQAVGTNVPTAPDQWVRVTAATPDQVLAALDFLRSTLATWEERRPAAQRVSDRMVDGANLPSPSEYAEALHTARVLVFTGEKLLSLYAGIIYSMPVYRLYPTTAEAEAIALWWPWGRPAPLLADGSPPRPPKPRRQTLDPSLITATRPQDVVREVTQKTGINRTTAQKMTAAMRAQMRNKRNNEAEHLLRQGLSKSEVARRVGLSPARISAMFPGNKRGETLGRSAAVFLGESR